jgi:hypothetical protein
MELKRICLPASLIVLVAMSACKKEYACVCTNPGGSYTAFKEKNTQDKAEQKCINYYNENFGSVPMSETNCAIK